MSADLQSTPPDPRGLVDLSGDSAQKAFDSQTKRIDAIANLVVQTAKAGNIDEATLNTHLTNMGKWRSLQEFDIALQQWHRTAATRLQQSLRIRRMGDALSWYKLGDMMQSQQRIDCWAAFKVFSSYAPADVLRQWMNTRLPAEVYDETPWVFKTVSGQPVTTLRPPDNKAVLTMWQLLNWQAFNYTKVIVKSATETHLSCIEALGWFFQWYRDYADKMDTETAAMQNGTLDFWKVSEFMKIQVQPAGS